MIHFQYQLKQISGSNGPEWMGPASILPADAKTGEQSGSLYYGYADIPSLDILSEFSASAISKYDFPFSPAEKFVEKIKDGYDTGLGYSLALNEGDRNAFASFLTQYANKVTLGTATSASMVALADTENHLHYMTLQEARVLLDGYGDYYAGVWLEYKA